MKYDRTTLYDVLRNINGVYIQYAGVMTTIQSFYFANTFGYRENSELLVNNMLGQECQAMVFFKLDDAFSSLFCIVWNTSKDPFAKIYLQIILCVGVTITFLFTVSIFLQLLWLLGDGEI